MNFWYLFFIILAINIIIIIILALPRKKTHRVPSLEGLDDPDVANAFEKMNKMPPFKVLRRKTVNRIKKLNPMGNLVDLGCGTGNLIIQIAKSFPDLDLIGIDISKEVLTIAEENTGKQTKREDIKFEVGNVDNLPLDDESMDFIISSLSLHHWSNPNLAFKEIFRVLKPNGTCLIFDFRRDSRNFFYGLLRFVTKVIVPKALKRVNEPYSSLRASYTGKEVTHMVKEFRDKEIEIEHDLAWMFIKLKKT